MNVPVTNQSNSELLYQYIYTLQRELQARKMENQEMHRYFEQTLPFIQQTTRELEGVREENKGLKGLIEGIDAKMRELWVEKEELERLVREEKEENIKILREKQVFKARIHEKDERIEELARSAQEESLRRQSEVREIRLNQQKQAKNEANPPIPKLNLTQNPQFPQNPAQTPSQQQSLVQIIRSQSLQLLKVKSELDLKDMKIQNFSIEVSKLYDGMAKYQYEISCLKNDFESKEVFLMNLLQRKEIEKNYFAEKMNNAFFAAQIERKDRTITTMTEQAYKANLMAFDQTLKSQKITIQHLTQLLLNKEKEVQALQNSNSTLRRLKINSITNEQSFGSLNHIMERIPQTKRKSLPPESPQEQQNDQFDKTKSVATLANLNMNVIKSRKFHRTFFPPKQSKNIPEDNSIPTSAQDRSIPFQQNK